MEGDRQQRGATEPEIERQKNKGLYFIFTNSHVYAYLVKLRACGFNISVENVTKTSVLCVSRKNAL